MVCHGPDPPEHQSHELPAPALPIDNSDSDDEADERYAGYMPLAAAEPARHEPDEDVDDDAVTNGHHTGTPPCEIPHIEPMETALVREVWNAPRTTDPLPMDDEQAQQVMQAMAGFELPAASVPAWARGLPDEQWRRALRDRVRALQDR